MRRLLFPALVLSLWLTGSWAPARASDIDTLRANIVNYYTGAGADPSDPAVAAALANLESGVRGMLAKLSPEGAFSDIDYTLPVASRMVPWQAHNHYSRMLSMASAYRTQGQTLYLNDTLKTALEHALDYIHTYIYDGMELYTLSDQVHNVWYWLLGVPMNYGPTLILLQGMIDSAIFAEGVSTINWLLHDFSIWPGQSATAGDQIIEGMNVMFAGILAKNTSTITAGMNRALAPITIVGQGADGIMADFSFHHHRNMLYTGGYGSIISNNGSTYPVFTRGTAYAMSAAKFDLLANFIAEGTRWSTYHNFSDVSVVGRQVTRVSGMGSPIAPFLAMAITPNPRQAELQRFAMRMLETWSSPLSVTAAAQASILRKLSLEPAGPEGFRHYPFSDYSIFRARDYYLSVKMLSARIGSAECINGEGLKSWHLSDGLTYILRGGEEYHRNHVWPTMDWNRLPGITVEKKGYPTPAVNQNSMGTGTTRFVGGVQGGKAGVSAMEFDALQSVLTAKKSWFFFEHEMVCLGSAIHCPSTNLSETVINQRPLASASEPTYVNGAALASPFGSVDTLKNTAWVVSDSIGYYFPGTADVLCKRATQSGRWRDIGSGDTILRSNPMLTLFYNHGANASGASYAYAVLPNRSPQDMAAYAAAPKVQVIANTAALHAVRHTALQATGAVFWQAGTAGPVTAGNPGIAFWRETKDTLHFCGSEPTQLGSSITFTIAQRAERVISKDPEVTVNSLEPMIRLTINVSGKQGKSFSAVFAKYSKPTGWLAVTVQDSTTGNPLSGAGATVSKLITQSDTTDSTGIAVIRTDTGANAVTVSKNGYASQTYPAQRIPQEDTARLTVRLSRLPGIGMVLLPDSPTLNKADTLTLSAFLLYSDSSVSLTPLHRSDLTWISRNSGMVSVDSAGVVRSGRQSGQTWIVCSSVSMGYRDSARITVRNHYRLEPVADAYVHSGISASQNFGTSASLLVKSVNPVSDYTRWSYLKFDISALSADSNIDSAILRLYVSSGDALPSALPVTVYSVPGGAWTETGITWNNKPALGAALVTQGIPGVSGVWYSWNVTDFLQSLAGNASSISLCVKDSTNANKLLSINSREAAQFRPVLEVFTSGGSAIEDARMETDAVLGLCVQPNPFNPTGAIILRGVRGNRSASNISVKVFNLAGQLVTDLTPSIRASGRELRADFSAKGWVSGVYLVRAVVNGETLKNRALLLK